MLKDKHHSIATKSPILLSIQHAELIRATVIIITS